MIKVQKFYLHVCAVTAFVLCLSLLSSNFALAAVPSYLPYPSADSSILNPYGENDESALIIATLQKFYEAESGRKLKIEQKPGRAGATAWGILSEKEGDGYSLAVSNLQSLILRSMASHPVFKFDEVFNCNILATAPLVLWVPQESPFPNITELARSAEAYPNQLIIAGAGSSSQPHLASLRLNFLAGVQTIYLPYMGTSTAMQACKIGQAHAAWGFPMIEHGKKMGMRPLAVAAPERIPQMADIPTFDEAHIGLFENTHFTLLLPATTPAGTRQTVGEYFNKIIANQKFKESIGALGFEPQAMNFEDLGTLMQEEHERLSELSQQFDME